MNHIHWIRFPKCQCVIIYYILYETVKFVHRIPCILVPLFQFLAHFISSRNLNGTVSIKHLTKHVSRLCKEKHIFLRSGNFAIILFIKLIAFTNLQKNMIIHLIVLFSFYRFEHILDTEKNINCHWKIIGYFKNP